MSSAYPGVPKVTLGFGKLYVQTTIIWSVLMLFLAAPGMIALQQLLPEATSLYTIGAAGLVVHLAVLASRDVLTGRYDPEEVETNMKTGAVILILLGVYTSGILAFGASAGILLGSIFGVSPAVTVLFAVFYPVIDFLLVRGSVPTPGTLLLRVTALILMALFISRDLFGSQEDIPFLGRQFLKQF